MPSSIFASGGAFLIDGVHSDTWRMYIRSWTGAHQPTPRANTADIPGRPGKIPLGAELSSRLVTVDLAVSAADKPTANDLLRLFSAATNPETGPHTLIFQDDQPNYKIGVFPSSLGGGQANLNWAAAANGFATFSVLFEALDPHWYSINSYTPPGSGWQPRTTLASRTLNLSSFGNRATPIKFTIAYPSVSNVGVLTGIHIAYAGSSFTYNGTLGVGDTLVVDTSNFTVLKNGATDMAHWGGDDFPLLPGTTTGLAPGSPPSAAPVVTSLIWTDTNTVGANVTVAYTDRWM